MPEHWLILTISLIVTYFYGSVFTLLFLDVDFQEPAIARSFGIFSIINLSIQLAFGYFASPQQVVFGYPLIVHLPLLLLCIFYPANPVMDTEVKVSVILPKNIMVSVLFS